MVVGGAKWKMSCLINFVVKELDVVMALSRQLETIRSMEKVLSFGCKSFVFILKFVFLASCKSKQLPGGFVDHAFSGTSSAGTFGDDLISCG